MEELKGIRVFIATPGGLEDERNSFRNTVEEVNRDAFERGFVFIPVGWEFAAASLGRPQERINEDVERCDYLVLVLHDRWGSPPSDTGEFTSGTEEEYNVARVCASDKDKPMRNLAVLFKGVDPRQLSDPGEQLKKVLAFKEQLEQERALLYKTFDTSAEFEEELRGLLLRWLREHGQDGGAKPVSLPPPDPHRSGGSESVATDGDGGDLLARAEKLAKEGQLTRAESLYATAVAGRTDLEAMTQYIRFLRRTGRLDLAHAMSERLLAVAQQHGDQRAVVEALSNEGIIYRKKGEHERSTSAFERAVEVARDAGPDLENDLAFLLDNLGLTLRKQGRFDEALDRHLEALQIKRGLDDKKSLANTLQHAGAIFREMGRFEEALDLAKEAVTAFGELDYARGEAQARAILGEVYVELDDLDQAEREFRKSLELNEQLKSPDGAGMNLWQLGRVALQRGHLDEAESLAIDATRYAGEERSRPEALGAPMQLLGNIEMERGDFPAAIDNLEFAIGLNERNELGEAWTFADLARAHAGAGNVDEAERFLLYADERGSRLASERFQAALQRARTAVAEAEPQ